LKEGRKYFPFEKFPFSNSPFCKGGEGDLEFLPLTKGDARGILKSIPTFLYKGRR